MQNVRVERELLDHLDALQHLHVNVSWTGGRWVDNQSRWWITPKPQHSVRPQRQNTWVRLGRLAGLPGHRARACSNRHTWPG